DADSQSVRDHDRAHRRAARPHRRLHRATCRSVAQLNSRMQAQRGAKPPIGVIYNTSMNRPDAALALATLNAFEGKREARIGSVCVVGSGLNAAIYCDIVNRFYVTGSPPNANSALPVGLAAESPLPADPPMVLAAVERKNERGQPQYARSIRKL